MGGRDPSLGGPIWDRILDEKQINLQKLYGGGVQSEIDAVG